MKISKDKLEKEVLKRVREKKGLRKVSPEMYVTIQELIKKGKIKFCFEKIAYEIVA